MKTDWSKLILEKNELTLSLQRYLSNRNQSIDLQSKSVDWFLYDRDLSHKRVNKLPLFNQLNSVLVNALILYPLKTPVNFWFSSVFREYKMGTLVRKGLITKSFEICTKCGNINFRLKKHKISDTGINY